MLHSRIPLQLLIDSKSLFDTISKGSRTSERKLKIDIATTRQGYQANQIDNIASIRSEQNFEDGLPKQNKQAALQKLIQTYQNNPIVQQLILRGKN